MLDKILLRQIWTRYSSVLSRCSNSKSFEETKYHSGTKGADIKFFVHHDKDGNALFTWQVASEMLVRH